MTSRVVLVALITVCVANSADGQVTQPYYGTQDVVSGSGGYVSETLPMTAPGVPAGHVGMPGIQYAGTIAAGEGGQLYPYDRQDPWLHGHFQRVPAYGGFSSFRPYNYRHVLSQTQLSAAWGMPHGMPYSQQFWNKYRGSYLHGNLHSQPDAEPQRPVQPPRIPATNASYPIQLPIAVEAPTAGVPTTQRPIHVFPQQRQNVDPSRQAR